MLISASVRRYPIALIRGDGGHGRDLWRTVEGERTLEHEKSLDHERRERARKARKKPGHGRRERTFEHERRERGSGTERREKNNPQLSGIGGSEGGCSLPGEAFCGERCVLRTHPTNVLPAEKTGG